MRFMVLMIPKVYQGNKTNPAFEPKLEEMEQMGKFNESMAKEVELIALDGLQPLTKGCRLEFSGGKAKVTDGPHIETKEVFGGFWILKAQSKEQVLELMKRCPALDGDIIEIRQFFELEDFPADVQERFKEKARGA
jgi:hypothetical protein